MLYILYFITTFIVVFPSSVEKFSGLMVEKS